MFRMQITKYLKKNKKNAYDKKVNFTFIFYFK